MEATGQGESDRPAWKQNKKLHMKRSTILLKKAKCQLFSLSQATDLLKTPLFCYKSPQFFFIESTSQLKFATALMLKCLVFVTGSRKTYIYS